MPALPHRSSPFAATALAGAAVVFAALLTGVQRVKLLALTSEWPFDLTFFHNLVWNVAQGNGYRQSASYHEPPGIFAETHFEPLLTLAAPFYWVVPRVETLFAVQSALLALGAWGVWRIARGEAAGPWTAALAGTTWLAWWPLLRTGMADVRPLMWSAPLLILLVAALRDRRSGEALLWAVLASLSREEIPLLVLALLALWALRPGSPGERRRALGLGLGVGLLWLGTTALRDNATFYIDPLTWLRGGGGPRWGHTAAELLPTRLAWLGEWAVPVGAGALLAPEILLAAAPLFIYLFSQGHEWATWQGPYVHHASPALGLVAAASVIGWSRLLRLAARSRLPAALRRVGPPLLAAALLGGALAQDLRAWPRHVQHELDPWLHQDPAVLDVHRLAERVPRDAPVMTDFSAIALFSGRADVYCYQQEEDTVLAAAPPPPTGPLIAPAAHQPRWALVRRDHGTWIDRARDAGLVDVERAGDWLLLGPPSASLKGP